MISSIVGGLFVAVINHWLTRKKTQAETDKLRAETKKLETETAQLLSELGKMSTAIEEINYKAPPIQERIIYDGAQQMDPFDFEGEPEYTREDGGTQIGQGSFVVKENVLTIQRDNIRGRYVITLRKYFYAEKQFTSLPRNEILTGERKLRVSCEAKVTAGSHTLLFVIKSEDEQIIWRNINKVILDRNAWIPIDLYFRVPSNDDSKLIIDDRDISEKGSSVQIRKLVLAERIEE